jgi:hypothetical protein
MFNEPATMLTDYGLGALCALLGWRLWVAGQASMRMSVRCWAAGMGALAVASFAGGTVHGFSLMVPEPVLQGLWKGTALAVGLAGFSFFTGTVVASLARPWRPWLIIISCTQFAAYVVWMAIHNDFRYVIYNYSVTFAAILFIQIYNKLVRKKQSAGWMIAGVLVTFVAALVQQSGTALHPSFNHNDLYHVIQMAGMALLYRGAARLEDR